MSNRLAIAILLSLLLLPTPVAGPPGSSLAFNTLAEERVADEERENAELEDAESRDAETPDEVDTDGETPAEGDADEEEPDDETLEPVRSPDIFVPSEDISEDLEVTFPVDI